MTDVHDMSMDSMRNCSIEDIEYQKMLLESKAEKILDLMSFLVLADDCSEIESLINLMEEAVPILKKYCELKKTIENSVPQTTDGGS